LDKASVLRTLKTIFDDNQILTDEPMKNHTSFRIGGMADFMVKPRDAGQIAALVKTRGGVPLFVAGNGSNLLVSDDGIRGVVVKIRETMRKITADGDTLVCESGALLSEIAAFALRHSLGGFEFAAGIPGTLGGAVVMNAGAYGGEMKDVTVLTEYVDEHGEIRETDAHGFGYRTSVFSGKNCMITKSRLRLRAGNPQEIRAKTRELAQARREKQPLDRYSAGSTFKRPEGYFAGKLISDAGLRGYRIGGAAVSAKHCGFIINENNATCEDVLALIAHVRDEVRRQFGVCLEIEVKLCGL
jgi:UDP-N-acetylmuramate dehydrogenase